MAELSYPKNTALPFDPPIPKDCVDCGNNDFCQPINPEDPISFQVGVTPDITEVEFDMADFTGTNWTVTDGVLIHTPGSTSNATLAGVFVVGRVYRVTLTTISGTTGDIDLGLGALGASSQVQNIGGLTTYIFSAAAATTTDLIIRPTSACDFSLAIDSIEDINTLRYSTNNRAVNPYFDDASAWVSGTGWAWSANTWTKTAGDATILYQTGTVNPYIKRNRAYRVVADITRSAGTLRLIAGNPNQTHIMYGREVTASATVAFRAYISGEINPAADVLIGFEADATFAGTVKNVRIFDLEEDAYKLFDCDGNEIGFIDDAFIDRVTDELTLVQIPSFSGASSGNAVIDSTFQTPIFSGTATGDTGATFEDTSANFTALNLQGNNVVHNVTNDTWSVIVTIDSSTEITTDTAIIGSGDDYEIYVWSEPAISSTWAFDTNGAYVAAAPGNDLNQLIDITIGETYLVKIVLSGLSIGSITPELGTTVGTAITVNGENIQSLTCASVAYINLVPSSDFDGYIQSVEVYQELEDGCYKFCSYKRYGTATDTSLITEAESTFQSTGNWDDYSDLPSTAVISGGKLTLTVSVGNNAQIYYNSSILTVGQRYVISVDIDSVVGFVDINQVIAPGPSNFTLIQSITTAGHYEVEFTCSGSNNSFGFSTYNDSNSAVIDNVYIRRAFDSIFVQDKCTPCLCLGDWSDCTLLFSWTNDDDAFGIDYTSEDFIQYMRLPAEVRFSSFPTQRQNYIDSNGTNRLIVGSVREEQELYIGPVPRYVHQAMAVGLTHDHFYIDGTEFSMPDGQYEPTRERTTLLQEATVPIEITTQDNYNANC